MAFHSINEILATFQLNRCSPEQLQFISVCQLWPEVVGPKLIDYTRPLSIVGGVLQVAAPSSAWTQNLTLQRYRLLQQLNARLTIPLKDIRFSTPQWSESQPPIYSDAMEIWANHPSRLADGDRSGSTLSDPPQTPGQAFAHWAESKQSESKLLPLCPQCDCPTPPGELERWSVCGPCFAQGDLGTGA